MLRKSFIRYTEAQIAQLTKKQDRLLEEAASISREVNIIGHQIKDLLDALREPTVGA